MIKRTIDISEQAYLHIRHNQLLIDKQGVTVAEVSVEDLGILILQHPAITITQATVRICQQNNVAIIFCDERHLPLSVALPLWEGHSLHTKVLRTQLKITEPTRKRLWQQIIKHKISTQAETLELAQVSSKALLRLKGKVKSGDPENCEAQAAKIYWPLLMGKTFRRNTEAPGTNGLLNYGYAIIRAMIARAIVGTGLHPAIGLHHKNQYNGLCLADDLMEPFRPWVDWQVFTLLQNGNSTEVDQTNKSILLSLLGQNVLFEKRKMPLMAATHLLAANLKQAFEQKKKLHFPQRLNY